MLEFDPNGRLVNHFGRPGNGCTWPASNHGLQLDAGDNNWIGGNGQGDSHVLKFTRDRRFVMQVGKPRPGVDSNSMTHFSRTTKVSSDENGEVAFVENGYGNKRIGVVDSGTGEFLRYCGAYRNRPDDGDPGGLDRGEAPA